MNELKWWQHLYYSARYGIWGFGWQTRKQWPGKPYWMAEVMYYDGWHWVIHIGPFYINASYY